MSAGITDGTPFFSVVVGALQDLNIPYMITGSMCCTAFGEPRSTNDVDIVIDPELGQVELLVERFQASAYISREAALDAFRRRTMFNVISNETMEKIDFILLKQTAYGATAFGRRSIQDFGSVKALSTTPEDAILSKLVWSRRTLSEVQSRDIVGIVRALPDALDMEYLRHWGSQLGVLSRLEEMLKERDESDASPD